MKSLVHICCFCAISCSYHTAVSSTICHSSLGLVCRLKLAIKYAQYEGSSHEKCSKYQTMLLQIFTATAALQGVNPNKTNYIILQLFGRTPATDNNNRHKNSSKINVYCTQRLYIRMRQLFI